LRKKPTEMLAMQAMVELVGSQNVLQQ